MDIDLSIGLKLIGSILTGVGSILLAWRLKALFKWVSLALNAHEISIEVINDHLNGKPQAFPSVSGAVKNLNDVEAKLGTKLLVTGFACLGIGMILNAISIVL